MGRHSDFSGPRSNGNPRPVEPGRDARHALAPWAQQLLDHMVEAYGVSSTGHSLLNGGIRGHRRSGLETTINRLLHGGKANEETVRRMEEMLEKYR